MAIPTVQTRFDETGRFVIEDYLRRPPFASFLPGIGGLQGIPMWVFYVNRGQGIASVGVGSKDAAIIEFQPANKAYQSTPLLGFRTFIKSVDASSGTTIYEPFSDSVGLRDRQTRLAIGQNEFEIQETNAAESLKTAVLYFTLPGEPFAALVRRLSIRNTSPNTKRIELLDGLPAIIPFGIKNYVLKEMSNVAMAWMGVENVENGIPYYRIRSSIEDKPEVEEFKEGHFYLCFHVYRAEICRLQPLVDGALVFGSNTSLTIPQHFLDNSLKDIYGAAQIQRGRVPCGFFGASYELRPGEEISINALVGHIDDVAFINQRAGDLVSREYVDKKLIEARALTDNLTSAVQTVTASADFDLYCRQNYLDNLLRGGTPVLFPAAKGNHVYYVYSRKHGDPEREYNFFNVSPEYYSQGEGNYRDINQNRRCDVMLHPAIGDYLIRLFTNLIQTDGYNPLVIKGCTFETGGPAITEVLELVNEHDRERTRELLSKPFTPGSVMKFLENHTIGLAVSGDDFLSTVLYRAEQHEHAEHGEGYWVDHWTYTLDLIDSYIAIFPEQKHHLLFSEKKYTFYDNAAVVVPRSEKYVRSDGRIQQLHAVRADAEKQALLRSRSVQPMTMRSLHGHGEIYTTTLIGKLLCLAGTKFSLLDPAGMGIEMEANKPGWYDALNGLPAMFGSSLSETFELKRLLEFLMRTLSEFSNDRIVLTQELWMLLKTMETEVDRYGGLSDAHKYWDVVSGAREQYREKTKYGVSGEESVLTGHDLIPCVLKFNTKVNQGLQKAASLGKGIPPTYFRFEAIRWEYAEESAGNETEDRKGQQKVRITEFKAVPLPLFLEGAVKAMKLSTTSAEARRLYNAVAASTLRDTKLSMYKVNESLQDQPAAIGRATAFPPGWLENESIFLHMQYKYLLSILKAGLHDEFFGELRKLLVPFFDPEVYGRSILENSTFLASSAHVDPTFHGRGFVARLSGSTAEFLNIWFIMMVGERPFFISRDGLALRFIPCLPRWLFKGDSTLSFTFLGKIRTTYHNGTGRDLYPGCGIKPQRIVLHNGTHAGNEIHGDVVEMPWSAKIREGKVEAIDVYFDTER